MTTQESSKKNTHRETYRFDILSLESVLTFLKALNYEIVEFKDGRWEGYRYDETWVTTIHLCAVKPGEKANLYENEIPIVFRQEFDKALLKALIHTTTLPAQPEHLV